MTWFRPALITMALAALAGSACSRSRAAASESADVPTVAVAKATRGDIAQSLTIAAEFRPFQEIEVHAKVAGLERCELRLARPSPKRRADARQELVDSKRLGDIVVGA